MARRDLTRFNNVFWVAERSETYLEAGFANITFPPAGPGVHGVFTSDAEWRAAVDEHQLWTRQYILLSAASLLEVYLSAAARSALTAKPVMMDAKFVGADGYIHLIGKGPAIVGLNKALKSNLSSFTKGLWKDRLASLTNVFGSLPPAVLAQEPRLQALQDIRNQIAHDFGLDQPRPSPWTPPQHIQVRRQDCVDAIKEVSQFIRDMDNSVFGPLIGNHEMLYQYHLWASQRTDVQRLYVSGQAGGEFRNYIGGVAGAAIGAEYAKVIVKLYHSL